MGGKLVGAKRMTPDEYHKKKEKLLLALEPLTAEMGMVVPLSYREKESFGDIDVLAVQDKFLYAELRHKLAHIGVTNFFESGGENDLNFSVDFDGTQVDFMFFPKETIDFALRYISYNSLGMVIALTARQAGFKLSDNGLALPIYDPDNHSQLITLLTVSTDFDEVLSFLDFDPQHHRKGFRTMEEMHEFITRSHYFSRDFFSIGQLNHSRRRKIKQNKMYLSIKDYLRSRPETERDTPTKEEALAKAMKHFPNLKERYHKVIESAKKSKENKISRSDQKLMFANVYVPFEERRDFLKKITPLVMNHPHFKDMTKTEKIHWFQSTAATLNNPQ